MKAGLKKKQSRVLKNNQRLGCGERKWDAITKPTFTKTPP